MTIYEHPKTGDVFTIPDLDLHLRQLEAVQRQVSELLRHGFNPPSPPLAAPAASPDTAARDKEGATDEGVAESVPAEAAVSAPAAVPAPNPSLA